MSELPLFLTSHEINACYCLLCKNALEMNMKKAVLIFFNEPPIISV